MRLLLYAACATAMGPGQVLAPPPTIVVPKLGRRAKSSVIRPPPAADCQRRRQCRSDQVAARRSTWSLGPQTDSEPWGRKAWGTPLKWGMCIPLAVAELRCVFLAFFPSAYARGLGRWHVFSRLPPRGVQRNSRRSRLCLLESVKTESRQVRQKSLRANFRKLNSQGVRSSHRRRVCPWLAPPSGDHDLRTLKCTYTGYRGWPCSASARRVRVSAPFPPVRWESLRCLDAAPMGRSLAPARINLEARLGGRLWPVVAGCGSPTYRAIASR